jgi:hypothetical protein
VVPVRDRAGLAPEILAELGGLATLEEVVRWGLRQAPPREVVEVIAQDEYCHDVILEGPGGTYLAFDTT